MKPYQKFAMFAGVFTLVAGHIDAQPKPITQPFDDKVALVSITTPQVVMTYPACQNLPEDIPDSIAVAFKDAEGKVQLISTSHRNRRLVGDTLNDVNHSCEVIFEGTKQADYDKQDYQGWIHGVYTEDGQTVYALVHNEYWGHEVFPKECKKTYLSCWANTITWVKSVDGGKTYQLPPEDERLVLGAGRGYKVNEGKPYGFTNPSNILPKDGYLYATVRAWTDSDQQAGTYLIRKPKDAAWNRWEIWNGKRGFEDVKALMAKGGTVGQPLGIGTPELPLYINSVSLHEPSGLYVGLMGASHRPTKFPQRDGFYVAISRDLITWSKPVQVVQANYMSRFIKDMYPQSYYYLGSLIDPASDSRVFATVGDKPYIYATRISSRAPGTPALTELVRIPLDLTTILPPVTP